MKKIILIVFIIFCFAQITILSYLTHKGVNKGTIIKIPCVLYDPYHPIKGNYLALSFTALEKQNFKDYPELKSEENQKILTNHKTVYCELLKNNDDKVTIKKITFIKPSENILFIKAIWKSTLKDNFYLEFPFKEYYIQQNLAPKAEKILQNRKDLESILILSVDKKGNTRAERLEVNGKKIEDYVIENIKRKLP